jgi:ribosome recycling factor
MLAFTFVEGASTKPLESALDLEMNKPFAHFEKELQKLRTGRAHTSMLEDIKVLAYGSSMSLKDIASLSAPEPQLLVVQPWDKGLMADIEKAIALSEIGVTPRNDGNVLLVPLPKMSGSRRDELQKVLAKRLEEYRVAVRTIRKDVHTLIRTAEKDKKISEDYGKRLQNILQKNVDAAIEKAEQFSSKKEAEIKAL